MPMEDRKQLEPIDAFDSSNDVTYAAIVPATNLANENNPSSSPHQKDVIYAELAATQPPVVNADNSA